MCILNRSTIILLILIRKVVVFENSDLLIYTSNFALGVCQLTHWLTCWSMCRATLWRDQKFVTLTLLAVFCRYQPTFCLWCRLLVQKSTFHVDFQYKRALENNAEPSLPAILLGRTLLQRILVPKGGPS